MEGERRSSDRLNGDSLSNPTPASNYDEGSIDRNGDDTETRYAELLQDTRNIEKKVPVDRRKLERLILAGGKENESAKKYFQRVMESSGTVILWPSRLKIGAKSKKDPQVKIAGSPEGVSKAREMLLDDLDTKSNRVTLKINVAYSEHSHVIGREGSNIKKVHSETQCHIHFPDSNRFNQGEKSDQVSITGLYPAVEMARKRVRELQPIVVSFSLPLHSHLNVDHNSPDMASISQTYNVMINIKPQPQMMSMVLTVKGTMKFVEGLKLAVSKLVEYFTGDVHFVPPVLLYTDIAQQHHPTIIGREGGNLQGIMHETCTTIQMPDHYRSSQITISGPLDNAIEARNRLMGCLPIALLFDVADDDGNITDAFIGDLMSKLDVFLNVKPKAKQTAQSVIVKSIEQNMECVYEARRLLCEHAIRTSCTASKPTQHRVQLVEQTINEEQALEESTNNVEADIQQHINTNSSSSKFRPSPTTPPLVVSTTTTTPISKVEVSDMVTVIPPPTITTQKPPGSPNSISGTVSGGGTSAGANELGKMNLESSLSGSQSRLTVRSMIDYEKKKKQAEIALQSRVDPNIKRYPTDEFAGVFLSSSMPQQPKEPPMTSGPVAKGLESLHRSGFQALLTQANFERKQAITQEQNAYENITDLTTLLSHLSLEKYESNFAEEEIDFETFLTMSENDLKEVGVATLGARRKLQIAISEIKKLRQQPEKPTPPTHRPSLGRQQTGSVASSSHSKSTRLAPAGTGGYMNMSRSVRF